MNRYEVNVALNGQHYCKVALPLGLTQYAAIERAKIIGQCFKDGFRHCDLSLSLTEWNEVGRTLDFNKEEEGA